MKLLRHGPKGQEKPAMLDAQGQVRDLSGVIADLRADMLTPNSLARLRAIDPTSLPLVANPGRMAPPWSGMGKFICVGLNYADHAAESGMPVPAEPVLFTKHTSTVVGCNDPVVLPQGRVAPLPATDVSLPEASTRLSVACRASCPCGARSTPACSRVPARRVSAPPADSGRAGRPSAASGRVMRNAAGPASRVKRLSVVG
jgi:hypothetical protein